MTTTSPVNTTVSPFDFIDLKSQYRRLKPSIDARIQSVLDHGQYIMGPEIAELEARLAAHVGVRHCVGISDGTTALLVALMALGVKAGDEIITTPFTFIATGEMIALLGARPVFVDIDAATFNLDPAGLEAAITPRTRAIIPVSLYGQCADLTAINEIAARHELPVIEDAAQSFGATHHGRRSGGLSTIGTTSFFPSKPLGCYGDGGACFTDDDELARRMREIRVHGQDRRYHHAVVGLNGRLDTLQAAVLLAKLDVFDEEVAARASIGRRYAQRLTEATGGAATTPILAAGNTSVYAQFTVRVPERDKVAASLKAAGVPTAIHYPIPLHRQPAIASLGPYGSLPRSEQAAAEVLSLPMHPYLSDDQIEFVAQALAQALR
ncbi:MAG: DegT/DnrJ/EryC1/StrS family aminotransferase [Burkholderiaceae bacterium]